MKKVTTLIKSFEVLSVVKKEYSNTQLFICKLFKITPANESKLELMIKLGYSKGICFYDLIELDNGMLFKIIDKSIISGWIQVESVSKIYNYDKNNFNPKEFTVVGTALSMF